MAAPSIVTQLVQIGPETSYGVAVPATKLFTAMGVDPSPKTDIANFRASGSKYPGLTALNKEHIEGPVTGILTYTEVIYALASAIGNMATASAGGSAYSHTFYSKTRGSDVLQSYTLEKGDPFQSGRRATGCRFNEFGITFSHDGVSINGNLLGSAMTAGVQMSTNEQTLLTMSVAGGAATGGTFTITFGGHTTGTIAYNASASAVQTALEALSNIVPGDVLVTGANGGPWTIEWRQNYAQTNITAPTTDAALVTGPGSPYTLAVTTPTAGVTPTSVALVPVLPTELKVYLDDLAADLGTTQLTGVISVEFKVTGRQAPFWALNSALGTSFRELLESVPQMTCTITLANDDDADDLVTVMRSGATKFLRVEGIGPDADTGIPYQFTMDLALNISNHAGYSEQDPVYAAGIEFMAIHDPIWGQSNAFEVVNLLSGL